MKKLIFALLLLPVFVFAQNSVKALNYDATFVAGDTLTSAWIDVTQFTEVELAYAANDSIKVQCVVYYRSGRHNGNTFGTVTADTLIAQTDGNGFATKVLRFGTTNDIPGATYIKVRTVRLVGSAVTSALYLDAICRK